MSLGHVLITRPENDCAAIKQAIIAKNYTVTCVPFLKVVLHDVQMPDLKQFNGLVFTSQNAVRAFAQNSKLRDIDVYTVGRNTTEEADKNGFKSVLTADGNVHDLAALLSSHTPDKPFLYVRGEYVSNDLKSLAENVRIEEVISYHTDKIKEFDDGFELESVTHALFFSKRTAESFVEFVQRSPRTHILSEGLKRTKALCLGVPMVESLSVLPWQDIIVATKQNRDGILDLLD